MIAYEKLRKKFFWSISIKFFENQSYTARGPVCAAFPKTPVSEADGVLKVFKIY